MLERCLYLKCRKSVPQGKGHPCSKWCIHCYISGKFMAIWQAYMYTASYNSTRMTKFTFVERIGENVEDTNEQGFSGFPEFALDKLFQTLLCNYQITSLVQSGNEVKNKTSTGKMLVHFVKYLVSTKNKQQCVGDWSICVHKLTSCTISSSQA